MWYRHLLILSSIVLYIFAIEQLWYKMKNCRLFGSNVGEWTSRNKMYIQIIVCTLWLKYCVLENFMKFYEFYEILWILWSFMNFIGTFMYKIYYIYLSVRRSCYSLMKHALNFSTKGVYFNDCIVHNLSNKLLLLSRKVIMFFQA